MYEFTGRVRSVGELKSFTGGFTMRAFVVDEDRDSQWPNSVSFVVKRSNTVKLNGVNPGERVKLSFVVDGREWTDPKSGKVRNFTDLTVLDLERLGGVAAVAAPAAPVAPAPQMSEADDDDGDFPF